MELQPLIDGVREQLLVAAENSGAESRLVAERMTATIDSALRLALLESVSTAAEEITLDLAPGSVDVRLRGRDPEFAVTLPTDQPVQPAPFPAASPVGTAGPDDSDPARITLRLSESLKSRIEEAAGRDGLSVNAWLVRVLTAATNHPQAAAPPPSTGQAFTGWVR